MSSPILRTARAAVVPAPEPHHHPALDVTLYGRVCGLALELVVQQSLHPFRTGTDRHPDVALLLTRGHDAQPEFVTGFDGLTTSITSSEVETGSPSTSVITSPMGTLLIPSISSSSPPRMPAFSAGPSALTSLTIAPLAGKPYSLLHFGFGEAGIGGELVYADCEHGDPDVAVHHLPVGYQLGHHALDGVYRDGETDALEAPRLGGYLGVDPYDRSPTVEQRPSGVAGVYGRVGLDRLVYRVVVWGLDGTAVPLTMPVVTLIPTFRGLPMAMTGSPTPTLSESPERQRLENASRGASTFRTATSVEGSSPDHFRILPDVRSRT